MVLDEELRRLAATAVAEWRPTRFDLRRRADRTALERLFEAGVVRAVHDRLDDQLLELCAAREPPRKRDLGHLRGRVVDALGGRPAIEYGEWVWFPWTARLVHVLGEVELGELRCDRNRYKLTAEEQAHLRGRTIGIAGLSVGQAAAITLALEGVGGAFRLADGDALSLSNLNRLRAGVDQIGVNKVHLAAREMFEIDPYLRIAGFPAGITDDNLDDFLCGEGGKLDLLVEECDDLYMKVRLRERARELGIPVIMETSDRGLLDVERFDREPSRPLFHGLVGEVRAAEVRGLAARDKVPFVLKILGADAISTGLAASLPEIDETVTSWPQLASSVMLGGAVIADTARRILLDRFVGSGRFYIDLERLVREGAEVAIDDAAPLAAPPSSLALAERVALPPPARGADAPSVDEIRWLVAHAVLAPSGGNSQPWRFTLLRERLRMTLDPARTASFLDFQRGAAHAACGAAVENLVIAAAAIGLAATVAPYPVADDATVVCDLTFVRDGRAVAVPNAVYLRVTNRRAGARVPLAAADGEALAAACGPDARITLLTDGGALDRLAAVLGAGDRFRLLSPVLHRELYGELRFTAAEVEATRDGVDAATLELTATDAAGLRVLASPSTAAYLARVGGGSAFERGAHLAFAGASAAALITVDGADPLGYFQGGRAMERVWLAATEHGLACHPYTALIYLFARLERAAGAGFSDGERRTLTTLLADFRALFPARAGGSEVLLLRLARADPPTARSLRRPVDDVLTLAAD